MKGVLVGSGNFFSEREFLKELKTSNILIAVDGGIDYCLKLNKIPDMLIGDLDSISDATIRNLNNYEDLNLQKYPKEKDFTDMELGINYLIDNDYKKISIFGGTGFRLDHTLANIFLISKLSKKGIEFKIIDDKNYIYTTGSRLKIFKKNNQYISIIPITDEGAVVSLIGFKYELDKYNIEFGSTIGVSNELVQEVGYINVEKGKVLVFSSKD